MLSINKPFQTSRIRLQSWVPMEQVSPVVPFAYGVDERGNSNTRPVRSYRRPFHSQISRPIARAREEVNLQRWGGGGAACPQRRGSDERGTDAATWVPGTFPPRIPAAFLLPNSHQSPVIYAPRNIPQPRERSFSSDVRRERS
ncbi:hypothetical protein SKAU_G00344370 [Synaphobranchus kaupii]|uniref:Uncharacterized protein n=1 Tax=Synaphobranchus kaupii TaxID=118154 RepID=A0A9Q1EJB2_SYNKA|nr:hypothetical protein SKAU_G00344370 [Synaphobranchus kaupii]